MESIGLSISHDEAVMEVREERLSAFVSLFCFLVQLFTFVETIQYPNTKCKISNWMHKMDYIRDIRIRDRLRSY